MELDRYVADLRRQLAAAAAGGTDETRALAEQLSTSLDAATRLVLLEALSEAAGEITRDIAPGSVELRLRGRDPEFAVSLPAPSTFVDVTAESPAAPTAEDEPEPHDDTSTSRTTLRLPDQLKLRAEKAAAQEGLSVNTWLVRAVAAALESRSTRTTPQAASGGNSFTGWAR